MFQGSHNLLEVVSGVIKLKISLLILERCVMGITNLFGFALLVYSYCPTGLPTPFWAKVVERDIYRMYELQLVVQEIN